jgi:hypothetical protein
LSTTRRVFDSEPYLDILGSYVFEFSSSHGHVTALAIKKVPLSHSQISLAINYKNPLNHPSVAFRRLKILSIGGYRHRRFFEDYQLWLVARSAGLKFANLPVPLVFMRRDAALSRRSGFSYAYCELLFFLYLVRRRLVSFVWTPVFVARIISRLLPSSLQRFQDILPWRTRLCSKDQPELISWISSEQCAVSVSDLSVHTPLV